MIQIQDLSYKYSGAAEKVFDGLILSFGEGKIYGLLGKNGVGKSTLLNLLGGLLMPREGKILIDGYEPRLRQPSLLEEVFYVPDEFSLPAMSLARYVKYNVPFYPRFSQEILEQCLQDFEITMDTRLDNLSLGEKKRVLISFALATRCHVLLMDEPTNGLDIPAKSLFRKMVARHMGDDQTIIISTHQVHDVDALLDHVVVMGKNSILLDASIGDIQERYAFKYYSMGEPCDEALYSEPTPQGRAVIVPNTSGEDTTVNLELLFNAIAKGIVINS
ncbi:MAG: ABC transporter ATP-binding protein [Prevotella sp.]|nr:ABC transporter ATP-binding protein [Prevotella sp.]